MTLIINKDKGYATEITTRKKVVYDMDYWYKLKSYEDTDIDKKLMKCRADLVGAYCGPKDSILDFGCGTGQFIRKIQSSYYIVYGWDIMIGSKKWLRDNFIYLNPYFHDCFVKKLTGVCFWDSLEHLKNPAIILNLLPEGCYVFISIPIFNDLDKIKQSKHYRPGEHYWYFTYEGLINYMQSLNYVYKEYNECESRAGREDIYSYVFRKYIDFNINQ